MSEFDKFVEMLDGNVLMERHYRVQMENKDNWVILLSKPYKKKQALVIWGIVEEMSSGALFLVRGYDQNLCGATAQEVYDRWSAAFDELLPF